MTTISGSNLRPGHVVAYRGEAHCIARIERHPGWAWAVASDDGGWAIAVGPSLVDVYDAA